jgi:Xaa-Pro dipeptidase
MVNLDTLFKEHLQKRMRDADIILQAQNYKSLLLGAGEPFTYFSDDSHAPFRVNPHFAHWCPANGPYHVIKYESGKKPILVYYSPDDYWHLHTKLENTFWTSEFEIREVTTLDKIWDSLGDLSYSVFIGNDTKFAATKNIKLNCELVEARLNWYRRFKSNFEIFCLSEANKLAATGHNAAKVAFLSGASEYEIHMAYLSAIECTDHDLPYTGIVALNQNGAILHYHGRNKNRNGQVLLIDSGAKFFHYGSDITRTYATNQCDPLFLELLAETEKIQQELCHEVKSGLYFPTLHEQCHLKLASALEKVGILKISGDYELALKEGITKVFMPHGLGHMLGVQVHDIGGKQLNESGSFAPENPPNVLYRSLRFVGTLENSVVVTIEPGIYFIQSLLNQFKQNSKHANKINWDIIEKLTPYGGIRIEDNVVPLQDSYRNLTREYLP